MAIFKFLGKTRKYAPNAEPNNRLENKEQERTNHQATERVDEAKSNFTVIPISSSDATPNLLTSAQDKFENFVRQNFEEMGRTDAMTSPESNYLKLKINTLRADMLSMATSAVLEVEDSIHKIDAWIEINNRFANIDTAARLKAEKESYDAFNKRLNTFIKGISSLDEKRENQVVVSNFKESSADKTVQVDDQIPNNDVIFPMNIQLIPDEGECRKLILSYMSGFVKGIAALSYVQFLKPRI